MKEHALAKSVAIVLAGGSGSRMGGDENKVYLRLANRPLLSFSLGAFNRAASIDDVVVVVREGEYDLAAEAVRLAIATKVAAVVAGGSTRQESEWAGLDAVRDRIASGEVDVIALHDGARPFVTESLIDAVVGRARSVGGAVPGLPVEEPLFERTATGFQPIDDRFVRMQTPQAFRAAALLAAHDAARRSGDVSAADTAETVERFGPVEIAVVAGDPNNVKVTYANDLEVARGLARDRNATWRALRRFE